MPLQHELLSMSAGPGHGRSPLRPLISVVLLAASGLVLASSWQIPWPPVAFYAACLIGLISLVGVVVGTIVDSQREHTSLPRTAGRGVSDGLRYLRDFL